MVRSFLAEAREAGWIDGYRERYRGRDANPHLVEYSVAFRAAVQAMVDDGELGRLREEGEQGVEAFESLLVGSVTHGGVMDMKTPDLVLAAPDAVLRDALLHMVYCKPAGMVAREDAR